MSEVKITKAMMFEAIKEIVAEDIEIPIGDGEVSILGADIIDFCNASLKQIKAKAEKAKERSAEKKAEGDALRAEILSHITDTFQTADELVAAVAAAEGFEEVTKAKVIARLTQLCKAGEVVKEQKKIGERKLMCYALPPAEIA